MTAFPRINGAVLRKPLVASGSAVASFLIVPLVVGWLLFVVLDAYPGLLPQEIRISKSATTDGATWAEYDPYMDDFVVFYAAGRLAPDRSGDAYSVTAIHDEQAALLESETDDIIRLPFFNPPQYLAPLSLIALLPMHMAAAVWTLAGLALFGAAVAWVAFTGNQLRPVDYLAVGALAVSMPFHEVILHGQMTFALFAGAVAIYAGSFRGNSPWLTAAGLTLIAVKPQLLLAPGLYLVFTRQWAPLTRFAGMQATLVVAATVAYGITIYADWLRLAWSAISWEDENGVWIHAMFGWNAFVRAAVGSGHEAIRAVLTATLSLATLGFVAAAWLRGRLDPVHAFATVMLAAVLLSPHLFAQDLLLCGAPILVMLLHGRPSSRATWLVYGVAGWVFTFWHFSILLPGPTEPGVNFVSLWLAAGIVLAAAPAFRHEPSDSTAWPSRVLEEAP